MTSRLKHKLDLEQINVKSHYLNESFVQIGTPLPALAETRKDKLEYVPEWQQEVRDEQGRRRFHGAFTGGYSAGYYNSVGSKEGWAPTTFKSSRTNRANKVQRPEDFMDEEDLAQMKEDRTLENTETFKSDRIGSTSAELANRNIPSALQSLIEPAKSSIGQTLLQKQGWRPGQGIGPRISLRRLKMQDAKSGRIPPTGSTDEGEDEDMGLEEHSGKHLFAPRDTKLVTYEQKEEKQGLGYVRGMGRGIERAKPLTIRANHVDMDDDDDPYSVAGPSTSARPFAFTDEDEDMPVVIGQSSSAAPVFTPKSRSTGTDIDTGRWHDGRPVLNGFELDPLGVPADKWFEMPDIPPDWRPRPARVWGSVKKWDERPEDVAVPKEVVRGIPGRPLTFEQRGQALGEAIPPPPLFHAPGTRPPLTQPPAAEESKTSKAKSVFEYMSEKDRERIQAIAALARAGASAPPPLSLSDPSDPVPSIPPPRPTEVIIPPLSPRTAGAALRGFAPYGDDPSKQDRYRSYLSSQTLNTKTPNPQFRPGTIDEINKELDDFAGSARIFRPMSYAMSSRFTSGSASLAGSDMKQAKPGLHMYDAAKAAEAMELAKKVGKEKDVEDEKKNMTPRERAAKEGRFGVETRVVRNFYPSKLVCRRFGVGDPHPEGDPSVKSTMAGAGGEGEGGGALPKNDASWEDSFIHQSPSAPTTAVSNPASTSNTEEGERVPKSLAEVGMADDVNQGRDTLTYTKPSIDIFKAIFASDDEDSEEEGEGEMPPPKVPVKVVGPVVMDLETFKPVFQVKREREDGDLALASGSGAGVGVRSNGVGVGSTVEGGKKKRKKEKKAPRGSLSFMVDEEEEGSGGGKREGRKMERKEPRQAVLAPKQAADVPGGAEEEWVEKPNPVLVGRTGGVGRKGAADYM